VIKKIKVFGVCGDQVVKKIKELYVLLMYNDIDLKKRKTLGSKEN
jgi:hypothetical protein